jgi:hypothetical protein
MNNNTNEEIKIDLTSPYKLYELFEKMFKTALNNSYIEPESVKIINKELDDGLNSKISQIIVVLFLIAMLIVGLVLFLVYFVKKATENSARDVINYIKFYTHVLTPPGMVNKNSYFTQAYNDQLFNNVNESPWNLDTQDHLRDESTGLDSFKRKLKSQFSSNSSNDFKSSGNFPKYLASNTSKIQEKIEKRQRKSNQSKNTPTTNNSMERNERVKISMKRSESWDAKNQVYINSASIKADLAKKNHQSNIFSADENGISLPINIQEKYYSSQFKRSDNGNQINRYMNPFSNQTVLCLREDDEEQGHQ